MDNVSSDGTWETLQHYAASDSVIAVRQLLLGTARHVIDGDIASGEILVFVDADTLIEPDCLSRIVDHCRIDGIEGGIIRLAGFELTFRTSARDYPGISSGGKSPDGWAIASSRQQDTIRDSSAIGWSGGSLSQQLLSSHAHVLRFTVVENSGTLADQVRRRRLSTYQADAAPGVAAGSIES